MVDQDDWRLGDEPEPVACRSCGKRNRPGQPRCVICGAPLGDAPTDEPPLRTIGEAMGAGRGGRRRRERWWSWPLAAAALLAVVGAAVWQLMPYEPTPEIVDLPTVAPPLASRAPAAPTPRLVPTPRPARTLPPRPVAPAPDVPLPEREPAGAPVRIPPTVVVFPPAVAPPPAPARTVMPPIAPTGVPRVATPGVAATAPPARPPVAVPADMNDDEDAPRLPGGDEPPVAPPDDEEPEASDAPNADAAREKPALGTDLRDATRAYRAAIDVHNERVDAYNAIADELQRRDLDDPEVSVLERDLGRARADVERARAVAEEMRARMEAVRARYR